MKKHQNNLIIADKPPFSSWDNAWLHSGLSYYFIEDDKIIKLPRIGIELTIVVFKKIYVIYKTRHCIQIQRFTRILINLSLVGERDTKRISSTVDSPHSRRTNERACQETPERKILDYATSWHIPPVDLTYDR